MSTRAVYTFIDKNETYHIYKHSDGYPLGAYQAIQLALSKAWDLPRFESSEFAAAFVAANKEGEGRVYLTDAWQSHPDLEFRYEIYFNDELKKLMVSAYKRVWDMVSADGREWNGEDIIIYKLIYIGTLEEFKDFKDFREIKKESFFTHGALRFEDEEIN